MAITYFITGANRGIGFEFAKQVSADSNNIVFATTRSLANATALQDLHRSNLHIIELDIGSSLEVFEKSLAEPLAKFAPNGVDIIIQNAGIAKNSAKRVIDSSPEEYEEHYRVNVVGSLKVYQSLLPYWSKQANPETPKKFIFINSVVGWVNNFYPFRSSHYGASKAALNHLTRHICFDNKSSGSDCIKNSIVIAVHPGLVLTDLAKKVFEDSGIDPDSSGLPSIYPDESVRNLLEIIDNLTHEDNNTFISNDGTRTSW